MIKVYPDIETKIKCYGCGNDFPATGFHLTGMHVLCSGICPSCKNGKVFKEMPTSAGLHYPAIIRESDGQRVDDLPFTNWYVRGLTQAYLQKNAERIQIQKMRHSNLEKKKVLFLNTIDQTYGHCVFNLFNFTYYREKTDCHIILLVQKNLLWMVPNGVDEVWVVDLPFAKAIGWFLSIEEQVNAELKKYEAAFLCRTFPQALEAPFSIEEFTKVKPFPLEEWDARMNKPTVTFIWRADRFWKRILPRLIENRFTIRWFPKILKRLNRQVQLRWILKFAEGLKRVIPTLDFAVAGMDNGDVRLPSWIGDFRYATHTDEVARKACERYAQSHLVIGCNGSSLVLPSCHAGSVVNIVPADGWAVSAGSFQFRFTSLADTHFRYLLLPAETSVNRTVKIVAQMLRDRGLVQILSGSPWNDHRSNAPSERWSEFRKQSFSNNSYIFEKEGRVTRSLIKNA